MAQKRPNSSENTPIAKRQKQHREPQQDQRLLEGRRKLPIWSYQEQIRKALQNDDVLILVGPTGSGKSTQVPQFLLQETWCRKQNVKLAGKDSLKQSEKHDSDNAQHRSESAGIGGMIAVTQPRRVAATTLARRVAQEAGTPLTTSGVRGLVGYSVRFDRNVPRGTKIKFVTEGMLLQEIIRDPHLRQYSAVIIDEIHERSIDVDMLAGFIKQIVHGDKTGRGGVPLKVVIMSATADVEAIQSFFSNAPTGDGKVNVGLVCVEGRQYPVTIVHSPTPVPRPDVHDALVKRVFQINQSEPLPGDILAFLTGQEEIEDTQKLIEDLSKTLPPGVPKIHVCPLYGQLSMEAQSDAFRPVKDKMTRKVVLATNIAETSVTVPGVRYVIDCGDAKVKLFNPMLGLESLRALPISKSAVTQRTGRAGREAPGKCYRLYTEEAYESFIEADLPEILRVDIVGAVLSMKAHGIDDVYNFPLMDRPSPASIEKALVHLNYMGALDAETMAITDVGKKMALLPVTAPFGRVLLAAAEPWADCVLEVIDIISLITAGQTIFYQLRTEEEVEEVEELRKQLYRREGDLLTYLAVMQAYAAEHADRVKWCWDRRINVRNMRQALNIRKQLRYICKDMLGVLEEIPKDPQPYIPTTPERANAVLKCFLKGFGLNTAFLAPDKSYLTAQGKHVVAIHPSSVLRGKKKEALMYIEHVVTTKSYVRKVSAIQAQWVMESFGS